MDDFHDFQNRLWQKPLVRPQSGRWAGLRGGSLLGPAAPTLVPALLAAPIATGIPTQGQTITTTSGQWTQSPETFYFQWLRNGLPISGATTNSYILTDSDVGTQVTSSIIAANGVGDSSVGLSRALGPIAETFAASATPVTTAVHATPYTGFSVAVSGGWAPRTFNLIRGLWPAGITMGGSTGVVGGTPLFAGTSSNITIQVTDRYGLTITLTPFTITVS